MSRITSLFVLLVLFQPLVSTQELVGVCNLLYCECTPAAHPSWATVNCTVPHDQRLEIMEGDLPESVTDIIVSGAEALIFGPNSLSKLNDLKQIRINGPKEMVIRKSAAVNLNVVSVYLEVKKCGVLRIDERAFTNIKGPLSVTLEQCEEIYIESESFSWLLAINITDVRQLHLGTGSFVLDQKAANIGQHGPGLTIELKNVNLPEIVEQTFGSSAALIHMEFVDVQTIRRGAFSANTYNIVNAVNCSFDEIESDAFAEKSLIHNLHFSGCHINRFSPKAFQSAVAKLHIEKSRFETIETGAFNSTVASVILVQNYFALIRERGLEFSSWNYIRMERNSFAALAPHAIVAPAGSIVELAFQENEIQAVTTNSLKFISQAYAQTPFNIMYRYNYYAQRCHCNITNWIKDILGAESGEPYIPDSYCTVDDVFAICFNVPELNIQFTKFLKKACSEENTIQCSPYTAKRNGTKIEIKNPRFPNLNKEEPLTDRNKKIIGIVIVTALGCIILVMFISFIRWMRRKGYCVNLKNFLISSNSSCGALCDSLCACGRNNGIDNARSISQLSINEYSERHRLNEPRVHDMTQETIIDTMTQQIVPLEDKTTQTLPEELTKELLENLKERLEDPENYVEAREMIEHLYELVKVEESCNSNTPTLINVEENIYELPFQTTAPRIGKNKKQMISIGTKTPSLDKLLPLSPYNRQTALAHEYFEPKDFAVHLYAEIVNSADKDKKFMMNAMPDVIGEQVMPRGPYLKAVREKMTSSSCSSPSTKSSLLSMSSPQHSSTIKSDTSIASNSSSKMLHRPLPEKPDDFDAGEGTSFKHG